MLYKALDLDGFFRMPKQQNIDMRLWTWNVKEFL